MSGDPFEVFSKFQTATETDAFAKYEKDFAAAIRTAIYDGYANGQREPEIVKIIANMINTLKSLRTSGPGFSIVCDSFFIHGRNSWVEFNHNSETITRELGDIIFMISVVRDWKVYLQRLTINQVKKTSVNGHSWNIDPEQLFLLSSLPTFSGAPGSWYYGSEISVPNLSGCLGSFGLIYNSDFIFESAIDLSDSLGDRQRISLHEVRTSISYLSALNNATINVARLPPLGFQFSNFRAASDATDFSTKFLRLSIGEWSFISPGWTDNPQARIVPKLIASVVEMLHKHGSDEFGMILKYLTIPYNGISYPNNNGPPPQESTPGEPGTAVFHVVVILE